MPKVSDAHRESRRAEILCAARRCFEHNGFHATSMQDILDESGLSAGAVYRYFAGKSDIVSAIALQNVSAVLDSLSCLAESGVDVPVADAVVEVLNNIRTRQQRDGVARLALQVWAESVRDPELAARFAATHQRFRTIVATLVRRRHPELATDADTIAGAVSALVPGFIHQLALTEPGATAHFEDGVRLILRDL